MSVDPVIIIKLMLPLFLDDVRSGRELMRIVPLLRVIELGDINAIS